MVVRHSSVYAIISTLESSCEGSTRRHALRHQVLRLNQVGTRPDEENAANSIRIRDIVLAVQAIRARVHVYLASLPAGKRLEDGGRRQRRDGHGPLAPLDSTHNG